MCLSEEKPEHEIGAEIDKKHAAGEGEDMLEDTGGDKHGFLEQVYGVFEDIESLIGFGLANIERG